MLIMTLFNKDQLTGLKLEMNEFVNNNIVSMITMAIDIVEDYKEALVWFFPDGYYEKNQSKCKEILYALKSRLASTVLYDDLKPIYNYVLFHIIDWWVETTRDTFPDNLRFHLPSDLKEKILEDPEWRELDDEYDEEDEVDLKNSEPFIITLMESAEEYIANCFEDTDFLEEDLRGAVQAAIHDPDMFHSFSTYEELDSCIDLMPLDVAEDYLEYRNKNSIYNIESIILTELINISSVLCTNASYSKRSSENAINDYYRDMLRAKGNFVVADQTRYGRSAKGKEAGEVDLLLRKDNKDVALIEGLKLSYVEDVSLKSHINKVLINYNVLGIPTFFLIYATVKDFVSFWNRLYSYLEEYKYPLKMVEKMKTIDVPFAAVRVASTILQKEGCNFHTVFIIVNVN